MPNGDRVASSNRPAAAAALAAVASGAVSSSGPAELTPPPTSPRRYQPLNSSSAVCSGSEGAGGKSAALAYPQETTGIPARASRLNLAMTFPCLTPGTRPRAPKPGKLFHAGVNGRLTLTKGHGPMEPDA